MNASASAPPLRPDDAADHGAHGRAAASAYGNRVVTSLAVREQHGHTLTWIENQPPDVVVFPQIDRGGVGDRQALRRACACR